MSEPALGPRLSRLRTSLLDWYARHARQLPWRETTDPYAIWISEVMLQQTQVATVIDYYARFLTRFPTVAALAAADEQEVLTLWSGLGYYRRAKQMHAAARVIVDRHAGRFPERFDAILALPGIGRYTAGAISSFAFGARQPIVEANTTRLFSRLMALRDEPTTSSAQKELWKFAEAILPKNGKSSGQVNQAVMELGSLVCTPRDQAAHHVPSPRIAPQINLGCSILFRNANRDRPSPT